MFKVQSDDQSLKISMESMKLKENQEEEYPRRNQYHSTTGEINQVTDHGASVSQGGGVWHGLDIKWVQQNETEKVEKIKSCERQLIEKGREYRIEIIYKNKSSLISGIIRKLNYISQVL